MSLFFESSQRKKQWALFNTQLRSGMSETTSEPLSAGKQSMVSAFLCPHSQDFGL